MRIRIFIAICLAVISSSLLVTYVSAQETTRLTVSVVASGGAPVATLSKADFSVQDSGKARAITGFLVPGSYLAKPVELGPSAFTNATDVTQSGAVFVVLDTIHTRYLDERDMRDLTLRFLGKASQAGHAVTLAIMSDKGLKVYHDFRTGPEVLLAALLKAGLGGMKGAAPPAGVKDSEVAAEAARLTAFAKGDLSNATPPEKLLRANIDAPLLMFQDVAHAATGLPGRKALVWITNAVPFDINTKTMQFQSPQEANRGVPVNRVAAGGTKDALSGDDIKRLMPVWRKSIHDLAFSGVAVYPVEARGASSSGSNTFTISVMRTLAPLTGGKAFYGTNDPFPELLQISNGNTTGYVLSYASDDAANGTDFRRVDVSVNNGNLTVYDPAGYFPGQPVAKLNPGPDIVMAMQSPLDYTGIIFRVEIGKIEEGSAGKKKVNLVIGLAGDSGVLNEALRKVDIGILAVATNAKGEQVGKMNEGAGGQFPLEAVQQIKELGFQLKRAMEVAPSDCTVHFVIRDNQTGQMGSLSFPLQVP